MQFSEIHGMMLSGFPRGPSDRVFLRPRSTTVGGNEMGCESNACVPVGKGSVGESGATSLLCHTVGGTTAKIIVLRNTGSSLCPNTGAVALLAVNGIPVAMGNITADPSSIQTEANPGDKVSATVHTIPLFNRVVCVQLGELTFRMDECDLVALSGNAERRAGVVACTPPATRDWYAWNDLMPPKPDVFHVVGEVQVPNPGVKAILVPRNPQGINPKILLLDLLLVQRPGIWPQIVVWTQATYEKVNATYSAAQIFCCDESIANVKADDIQ